MKGKKLLFIHKENSTVSVYLQKAALAWNRRTTLLSQV